MTLHSEVLPRAVAHFLVATALIWPASVYGQPKSSYTPEELRRAGQQLFNQEISRYGRIENPEWNTDVSVVLDRLVAVTDHPDLHIAWVVIDRGEPNAAAIPGGHILIFRGELEWIERISELEEPDNPARRSERERAYLATSLSHELSHILLGHTGEIMERMRAQVDESAWERLLGSPTYDGEVSFDPGTLTELSHGRDRELAADAAGALTMLRAGWQIQDAVQYWRYFGYAEREIDGFQVDLTLLRTHPRASQREAHLEEFRADLKLDQTRLDDAIALIRWNAELDLAIELIDTVLEHFPDLLPARHARVSALHRQWLNTVPLQTQQVRSTLSLSGPHFLPGIKGDVDESQLLDQARRGYAEVLEVERFPETLSNMALIEAYSGSIDHAIGLAREAAGLRPESGEIHNNLGVVLFLAGAYTEAQSAFRKASDLSAEWDRPSILFNVGRTQIALGDSRGRETLEAYLELDESSNWREYAQSLLGTSHAGGGKASRPTEVEVAFSTGTGVDLGVSERHAVATLGRPEEITEAESGAILHYPSKGFFLVVAQDQVVFIGFEGREAGSIAGIRAGDTVQAANQRLGSPTGHEENLWFYSLGERTVVVAEEGGRVAEIGIGFS